MAKEPRSLHLYVRRLLTPSPALLLRKGGGLLLIVDQFEELFTLCRDEDERRAFIGNLLTAVKPEGDGPTMVVLTLRADFYADCAQYENLREVLARHQEYIGPMSTEELRRAIELPAQRGGYEFEPGLVELILRDVGDEPGALPLLSHALLETWRRREGRRLTLAGYAEAGGVRGAIAQTAETVFGRLTADQQTIARRIFLRLTELGEGAQDTRRRVARAELEALATVDQRGLTAEEFSGPPPAVSGPPSAVTLVLQTLVTARLVTSDQEAAEVAHEALIREWPALRQWLNDNREGLRLHRRLSEAAQEWQRLQRDPSILYRGVRLAQASEWAEQYPQELTALEQQFLTAGKQAEENERLRELEQARALAEAEWQRAEAEQQRAEAQQQAAIKLRKRARLALAIGLVALIAAMVAGFFAWQANENAKLAATRELQAKQQADRAVAHRLAAEGRLLFEANPLLGLRLAMEGWALAPSVYEQVDQFIAEMAQHGRLLRLGQGDVETIYAPDKNPSVFILDRANASSELWRSADGSLITVLPNPVSRADFSPDEAAIYTAIYYYEPVPTELRRTVDGTLITILPGAVADIKFSSDQNVTYFVIHYYDSALIELRNTKDGTIIPLSGPISAIYFSQDKAATYFIVYYSDGTPPELRRTVDNTIVTTLPASAFKIDFSPDENTTYFVVHYSDDAPAEVRRTADGKVVYTLSHQAANIFFSRDKFATYFVVSYYDDNKPSELRRSVDGTLITTLLSQISNIVFSSDEAATYFVVSYKVDTPAELRRSVDGVLITTLLSQVMVVAFSPDKTASHFIVIYYNGISTELRRSIDGTLITTLPGMASSITFSPDEAATYFVAHYNDEITPELRHTSDGEVVHLSGTVSEITFIFGKVISYFKVSYSDSSSTEIHRMSDGAIVGTLANMSSTVAYNADESALYIIESDQRGRHKLWLAQDQLYLLADLGLNLGRYFFSIEKNRLIAPQNDGQTYLVDLAWLRAMGGNARKMPTKELVRIACEGPFAGELFDEAELRPYLGDRAPQACK
jgi:hypothetical protein